MKFGEVLTNLVQGSRVALSNGCRYVEQFFLSVKCDGKCAKC